ncbi:MAG TPA: DUF2298 domain-containing protein [Chloroflexota bacterium]|nr:DUF2298 domain-containing protein [Chloroflexota bacterium]
MSDSTLRQGRGPLAAVATLLCLTAILAVAAFFRLTGVNWDSFTHLHPDERFITMVENSLDWPTSLGQYFDTARSPLNPYNRGYNSFVYGTFPLFLVKWLGIVLNMSGYDEIHLVGRVVSALFDIGSVLMIFFIGRRLFGSRSGLLASLLSAGAVIQIQQSHFFTFDTFVGFFLLVSFFFAVRIWESPHAYDYPLLGASLGFAMACKINSAVFAIVVALIAVKQLREVTLVFPNQRMADWMAVIGRFAGVALVALLVFRVVEPYAFAGPGFFNIGLSTKFLNDIGFVQKLVSGEVDQPPSVQWANTPAYIFPLRNLVFWGMGLPLGVVGWVGLVMGAFLLLFRRETKYLLLVAWVGFFFLYQGGQFAKTMRYFLPIVPLLSLLGAQMLVAGFDRARERVWTSDRRATLARAATYALPAVTLAVAVCTLAYAYAFTQIYTRPVTRIEATEWIFANIPQGTTIANEHWDDPLPLRWKGRDAGWYSGTMLELYNDDTPEKYNKLVQQLDTTEYIFISSNRLYGSIPRMPLKYPMTTEYYRLLFSGQLGFRLEKTFTSHPTIFGIEINDDSAEEIFSVYDHPKVLIFHKTADYSPAKTRQLLGAVPLDSVVQQKSVEAQYGGLLLSSADRDAAQAGGTWSEIYDVNSLANRVPVLAWLLLVEVLGLLALPITWLLFRRFPDRGYGFAKAIGIAVTAYVAWIIPSFRLAAFGPMTALAGTALLAGIGAVALRGRAREFWGFARQGGRLILAEELVFLAAFGLFLAIRMSNPDLWHPSFGGEKPMEFAYLNAIAKTTYFPPYDPWFAGGYINYYYFGYVIVATLMRLTGIVPAVAFNLAIPTIYGLTAVGLFSFALNFAAVRQIGARLLSLGNVATGLAATVFVLVAGNVDGLIQRLESLWALGGSQFRSTIPGLEGVVKAGYGLSAVLLGGKTLPPLDFWRSTRLIPGENPTPIMEFPWFTFLYGDLHAHMIAMPLTVLALGLTLAIVWQAGSRRPADKENAERLAGLPQTKIVVAGMVGQRDGAVTGDSLAGRDLPIAGGEEATIPEAPRGWSLAERGLSVLFAGFVVGMLQATNSWDFPTYLILISASFLVASYARDRAITIDGLIWAAGSAGFTYVVAMILFSPYTRNYELFYNGVDPAPAKTDFRYYLVMFGLFLFCISTALIYAVVKDRWLRFQWSEAYERFTGLARYDRREELWRVLVRPSPWVELLPWMVAALMAVILIALVARQYLVALLIGLCLLALLSLFRRDASPEELLLSLFVGLGTVLTLGVEFITIKGDIGRMNTVFKFYLQAWFLLGLASALLVAAMLRHWYRGGHLKRFGWRFAWIAAGVLLVGSTMIYPWSATPSKVSLRFEQTPPSLDGMAYMQGAVWKDQNKDIVLAHDYEAIRWLQDHVAGSPVVLEAQIPEYRWGSRVSIYTGLPTILGWTWHQRQQRGNYGAMIDQRLIDIKTMYDGQDLAATSSLLRKYGVGLIYVGDLERAYYSAAGLAKFDKLVANGGLAVDYRADGVTIYEVKREDRAPLLISSATRPGAG